MRRRTAQFSIVSLDQGAAKPCSAGLLTSTHDVTGFNATDDASIHTPPCFAITEARYQSATCAMSMGPLPPTGKGSLIPAIESGFSGYITYTSQPGLIFAIWAMHACSTRGVVGGRIPRVYKGEGGESGV